MNEGVSRPVCVYTTRTSVPVGVGLAGMCANSCAKSDGQLEIESRDLELLYAGHREAATRRVVSTAARLGGPFQRCRISS